MNRLVSYAHCGCGTLVRCSKLHTTGEAAEQLAAAGGEAFGALCPACKAGVTVTVIPSNESADKPRVLTLTAM